MPDSPPAGLSAVLGLEPKDAVAFFESKGLKLTFDWKEVWKEARAQAFTVSSVARMDILQDIHGALSTALREGKTEAWFAKTLEPVLRQKGWWGKRMDVDTHGQAGVVCMGSGPRLQLIYRQNLQTAYMAGRYRQMLANADARPYWQYNAMHDSRTRPAHRALDGLVFRYDDEFWQTHYPPNGFNCRCTVRALNQRGLDREGLGVSQGSGNMLQQDVEVVDRWTGEVTTRKVTGYRRGNGQELFTDLGFDYNPGAAAYGLDMEVARRLALVRDSGLRAQAVQQLNNSPARREAFGAWVDQVRAARMPRNAVQVVGFVDEDVAAFVREQGHDPAQVLTLSDGQLLHADSPRHEAKGVALTADEYRRLPQMMAEPRRVLWDPANSNVVYEYPTDDAAVRIKIVAEMPATRKRKKLVGKLDAVVNAYRVPAVNLDDANAYAVIRPLGDGN